MLLAVLENLTAFTRYEVRVLAFTVKGDGVKSPPIRAGNTGEKHDSQILLPAFETSIRNRIAVSETSL